MVRNGPLRREPLARVFELGARWRTRSALGLATTVVAHAGVLGVVLWGGELAALTPPVEVEGLLSVVEYEHAPSAPEPIATVEPPLPAKAPRSPVHANNAATAAASTMLTQPAASEEEQPFDDSFVTGVADSYAGGLTSRLGKSIASRAASPAPAPSQASDLSRQAGLGAPASWDCDFPSEADRDEIDHAIAWIAVQVKPDGSAESVDIVRDPGHGFGRAAKSCAMKERFLTALDGDGRAVTGTTLPIRVDFTRRRH
jgi:periplasmic protein TonB